MPEKTNKNQDAHPDVLNLLVSQNIISPEQCDLVKADCVATGIAAEDILLTRRWITAENLHNIAPWLKGRPHRTSPSTLDPKEYQTCLERYRQLIERIMEEDVE